MPLFYVKRLLIIVELSLEFLWIFYVIDKPKEGISLNHLGYGDDQTFSAFALM